MARLVLILCAMPALISSITVITNGNSPDIKMKGGMMVDIQKGFAPMTPKTDTTTEMSSNYITNQSKNNSTKLPINERYRRLIPYMTFYYANDIATPSTEAYSSTKSVEIQKAEIVETKGSDQSSINQRDPKKIFYSLYRDIPIYEGNRLTQFNKALANPIKHYKESNYARPTQNYYPVISDYLIPNYENGYKSEKQFYKTTDINPIGIVTTQKPYLNYYNEGEIPAKYSYSHEEDFSKNYKLVPYEQTPPITSKPFISSQNIEHLLYEKHRKPIAVPVMIPSDHVIIRPRPSPRPQYYYETNKNIVQTTPRKIPQMVSEKYYEMQRFEMSEPVVETGFKPIPNPSLALTETNYKAPETSHQNYITRKPAVQVISTQALPETNNYVSNYNQYVEQPVYEQQNIQSNNAVNLREILNSLQTTKSVQKPKTNENDRSSIRTLLQVLNTLKAAPQLFEAPALSTPKPFVTQKVIVESTARPSFSQAPIAVYDNADHNEQSLAQVDQPSQHLDDYPVSGAGGSSQQFPQPVWGDEEGGTPGRPGVDYPVLSTIPRTAFNCTTQRYKGFFADPETKCQVWHYCDLNGGQASFLCPNGTIFSQAGLTCDWWFNVRCASTTQLYVLNESLYKFILPHSPKFPEDYSGPLVDKYLSLKFKEMEEQFKKNKRKMDKPENVESEESTEAYSIDESIQTSSEDDVREANVHVESPGSSGNVERLHE